jgi:BirA family transcriptional regulator, biotin operon repressor / biotin---[acetyl-CoA-carboxylase] ligase
VTEPPRFGRPRHHHRLVDSTNERARELAGAGAPDGTVVTASEQTAGRGRQGRTWSAPAGKALLCSVLLRPIDERHRLLPLSVPLAVCEAAESLGAGACQVKWPNDVWFGGRKLAGILIEAKPPDWAVIGIGLNLSIEAEEFPEELRATATSIGSRAGPDEALATVCEALGHWVEAPDDEVLAEFERRDALRGREIRWTGAGEGSGLAEGVDERGNLLVRVASGETVAVGSGEVHLTGLPT